MCGCVYGCMGVWVCVYGCVSVWGVWVYGCATLHIYAPSITVVPGDMSLRGLADELIGTGHVSADAWVWVWVMVTVSKCWCWVRLSTSGVGLGKNGGLILAPACAIRGEVQKIGVWVTVGVGVNVIVCGRVGVRVI